MTRRLPRFGNGLARRARRWDSVALAMTAYVPDDEEGDVRGLLAELSDLVGDLGLGEAPLAPRASTEPGSALPYRYGDEGDDDEDLDAELESMPVLDRPDAELAALAAALAEPFRPGAPGDAIPLWESLDQPAPPLTLWEAFAPELEAEPVRAWSPAAAMAAVEPAAPTRPPAPAASGRRLAVGGGMRSRLLTAATAAAAVVAVGVLAFTRLDLGHTGGPAQAASRGAFQVTAMRTVDAVSPTTVGTAPTLTRFPAGRPAIYMDVVYRNAGDTDTLRLVISLQPPAGSAGTPIPVDDETHVLPAGGEIAVAIKAPSTGFAPGVYTVKAYHGALVAQSLSFTVDPVTPAP
jgi:hypothetical protein